MAEKNDLAFILDPDKLSRIQEENPFVRISDAVYDILEEAILSSQYDPGAKLKINTIAEQLGVSGTPVREAIDRLILRGLVVEQVVEGKKYKSYRVFDMDDQDIAQLFIARKAIDGIAAYLCAEKNWRVDVSHLQDHAARFRAAMHEYLEGRSAWLDAEADRAFHTEMVNATQNPYLTNMYHTIDKKLNYLSVRTCEYLAAARKREDLQRICSQHDAIVNAIRMGFPQLARQVMDEHIDFCEANCLNHRAFSRMKENQF